MTGNDELFELDVVHMQTTLTLRELCEHVDVHAEYVIKLVDYGVINPVHNEDVRRWAFDLMALNRLRKAQRLQRDLKLNLPGLAVSLDLLDEVESLRAEVDRLNRQLRQLTADK